MSPIIPLGYYSWSAVNEGDNELAREASAAYVMAREIGGGFVSSDQIGNVSRSVGGVAQDETANVETNEEPNVNGTSSQ